MACNQSAATILRTFRNFSINDSPFPIVSAKIIILFNGLDRYVGIDEITLDFGNRLPVIIGIALIIAGYCIYSLSFCPL